jgi:purine-cytosine permease-like protein
MSSLAWKSLVPGASDTASVWSIGLIGTALGAAPGVWLEQYTSFMVILGAILVPVGGVLIAHFYRARAAIDDRLIAELYDASGRFGGVSKAGVTAWTAGAIVFFAAGSIGGTLPSLAVSMLVYVGIEWAGRVGGAG